MKTLLALLVAVVPAFADSQAQLAAKLNEEGKQLMFDGKYPAAEKKFVDAVARVPEAKYLFNLCTADYMQGKFGEALTACSEVAKHKPDEALKTKTGKLIEKIKADAASQHINVK